MSSTTGTLNRRAERDQLVERRPLGEAFDAEVRRVHAQERRRPIADRRRIVGGAGPVGRADLAQDRARLRHDVRHAEAAADLDQLAARDDHFAPRRQRRQHEQRRRGVVVDDDRGLGAGEPAEQPLRRARRGGRARRCRGRIRGWCSRRAPRRARRRPRASGARPRLVWRITPVALMTGCSDGAASRGEPRRHGALDRTRRRRPAPAHLPTPLPQRVGLGAQRVDHRRAAELRLERPHARGAGAAVRSRGCLVAFMLRRALRARRAPQRQRSLARAGLPRC